MNVKNKLGVINMLIFALLLIIILFICGYAGIISVFDAEYRYIGTRDSNPIWFKRVNFAYYRRKSCKYTSVLFLDFLCLISKFSPFKLFDLLLRKIIWIFNAEDEDRLTPFKDDKLKRL